MQATHAPRAARPGEVLEGALAHARDALGRAGAAAAALGMPTLRLDGQLIRPLVAYGAADGAATDRFWAGALALQMAHEASLVHDDIVDGSALRRGEATVAAARGVGAALVYGDHLLTASYRMAARTGSAAFMELFARAVERTVAGELAQARATGERLEWPRYAEIVMGKSGELLGCALALAPALEGRERVEEVYGLGRRIGLLYQMLDDLLDYCPGADTGKPALADYAQRHWTWPLAELPEVEFGRPPEEICARLHAADGAGSPMRRALARLRAEGDATVGALEEALGERALIRALLERWSGRAEQAVRCAERALERRPARRAAPSAALRARVPEPAAVELHLARNSHSFRFAARFFPPAEARRIAGVYSYCRVTDDLVDRPGEEGGAAALLEEWVDLSGRAYRGEASGIPFLDGVMGEMSAAGVPFAYAAELGEGMRMDLRAERYASLADLRRYTYRVASVVGLWLTEMAGVREPWALERAAELGHAMQLTNILRDVGEDARQGRIYLPADHLARHGLDAAALRRMAAGEEPIGAGYAALIEELLRVAESQYRWAFAAIPSLPRTHWRPVAVAAHLYRGIHESIRRNGYDNLRLRARTSGARKVALAAAALWELREAAAHHGAPHGLRLDPHPALALAHLPGPDGWGVGGRG